MNKWCLETACFDGPTVQNPKITSISNRTNRKCSEARIRSLFWLTNNESVIKIDQINGSTMCSTLLYIELHLAWAEVKLPSWISPTLMKKASAARQWAAVTTHRSLIMEPPQNISQLGRSIKATWVKKGDKRRERAAAAVRLPLV